MALSKNSKIAIIGGGILGLTLAHKFSKLGHRVTVLEKSSEFGGLASGLMIEGSELEKYYHHIFKSDTAFQELLKELGLIDQLQWLPSKMGIFMRGKIFNFSSALDILSFSPLNPFDRIRLGIVSFYLQKFATQNQVKNITALDWCKKYFGKSVTKTIWEPLLYSKFDNNAPKISMSWFLTRIHDRASSRDLPWKDEKLGYLQGSMTKLITALVKSIRRSNSLVLNNSSVLSYEYHQGKYQLTYQIKNKAKQTENFEIVIATIPPQNFIELFKPPKNYQQQLEKIEFMGAVCMVLKLKHQFSKYYWLSVNDPKAPFVAAVEHTNLVKPELFKNSRILYLGKYLPQDSSQFKMTDQQILDLYTNYLKEINPKFTKEWIEEFHVFRAQVAQHLVPTDYKVLNYNTGIPGLYYAHFAQIYPHDRGTNYAIAQAQELFEQIIK